MSKIFCINYETSNGKGFIMIYVGSFFAENRLSDSDRFLRFARTHCTREQQLRLLADLEEAKLTRRWGTERERIDKTIKKIEAQTWGQNNTKNRA